MHHALTADATAAADAVVKKQQGIRTEILTGTDKRALFYEPAETDSVPIGQKCMSFNEGTKERCMQDAGCAFEVLSPKYSDADFPKDQQPLFYLHVCTRYHGKPISFLETKMGTSVRKLTPKPLLYVDPADIRTQAGPSTSSRPPVATPPLMISSSSIATPLLQGV